MQFKNNLLRAFILALAVGLSSCGMMNKTEESDATKKSSHESDTKDDTSTSSKSRVPPSFGDTPRYRGGINPINPAGPGASGY